MATIAENLQTLVNHKEAIKTALETKGKEPTDKLSTYAGLIDELENEEQITYVLTNADGTKRAYAVKSAEQAIKLTATPNDIRLGTTAVTNAGYTEGEKDIPSYQTIAGKKIIQAGEEVKISQPIYDYTKIQATLANYNTSISDSVEIVASTIDDAVYKAMATTKLSDITKEDSTQSIKLGITAENKSVLRYFIMREEA